MKIDVALRFMQKKEPHMTTPLVFLRPLGGLMQQPAAPFLVQKARGWVAYAEETLFHVSQCGAFCLG